MKKKKSFLITVIIVLGIGYYFHSYYLDRKGKESFQKFNQSTITGEVKKIDSGGGQVFFTIEGDSIEYNFSPRTSEHNYDTIFEYTAEKGDSVFKASYSDTLYFFKGGKTYKYTFQKIE